MPHQHARGHRDRLLVLAAAREDEEAAARADMGQAHLLPLVLQVHLVGEADLHVVDQRLAARRLGRLAGRQFGSSWSRPRSSSPRSPVGPARGSALAEVDVDLASPSASRPRASSTRPMRCASSGEKRGSMTSSRTYRHGSAAAAASSTRRARPRRRPPRAAWPAGCSRACVSAWPFSDSACAGSSRPKKDFCADSGQPISVHALVQVLHQRAAAASGRSCAAPASPWAARS